MSEWELTFQIGDPVVHCVYGIGSIIQREEKVLTGTRSTYYVVQVRDLTIWVPINEQGVQCLRMPTPAKDFNEVFRILASPGETLSDDRYTRKTLLTDLLKDGTIESLCRVIRDLVTYKREKKINEHDNAILNRAKDSLLNEWSTVLSVPIHQAEIELGRLLNTTVL